MVSDPGSDEVYNLGRRAWRYVKREWPKVKAVKGPFFGMLFVLAGVVGFAVWLLTSAYLSRAIEGKDQQNSLLSATVKQHEATIEYLKATRGGAQLTCPARLESLGLQGEGKTKDGHSTISRLYRIIGQPPYAVKFKAFGVGFIDLLVKQRDWKRTETIAEQKIKNGKVITINEPRGLYEVTVIAKDDANLINLTPEIQCEG